jgi:heptosyltransferase-1
MPTPPSHSAPRVLIIRPSALGDVCRSVPVLAALRTAYPAATIDWLVQDTFAPAIASHPALTRVVPFVRSRVGKLHRAAGRSELRALLSALRSARYDIVLDCQGLARSGVLTRITGAPLRVGHADARELAFLAYSRRVPHTPGASEHTVDRMLELLTPLGITPPANADMRLHLPPALDHWPSLTLGLAPGTRYALLAPTSRWLGKRWPADRFAEVARRLLEAPLGLERIAFVGTADEQPQITPMLDLAQRDARVVNLAGRTSIAQLMALVRDASLVVANDSAAVHMAVGFDRPMVALFGPTDIRRVGPYRRDADVIQHVGPADRLNHKDASIGQSLMARITTDEVMSRATQALSR